MARPQPRAGALVTFDAQLAKQQEEAQLAKSRPKRDDLECYTGPKVKWEDTGLYKAMVKTQDIEEELTKIRNLIRKRTDPGYEPDDDDFNVAPVRKFDAKVDYYKLLDVDDFATVKDIKGAYKKFALLYHPDKNADKKPDKLREMQDEFEKIQAAYEILSDRATRRQYDRSKFDEGRAKSQGMNSSFYSQKTDTDNDFWGRWSAKKEKHQKETGAEVTANWDALGKSKAPKLKKAPDLRVEVKISLEKALRGGLKILEVKRDRMQRAFGGASRSSKTVNVKIDQGQADGSEYRLDGDGHWPNFGVAPGDLVIVFKHKTHSSLRQVSGDATGRVELATPLAVRAKATEPVLSAWTPTFKGHMLLLRFRNPLLAFAPSKGCSITFVLDGEGLPVPGDGTLRGPLIVTVKVQLDGSAFLPSMNVPRCMDRLMRRHVKDFNRQPHLKVKLSNPWTRGLQVRKYLAETAKERDGASANVALPVVIAVWEAPAGADPVSFAKASAALGWHAQLNPEGYGWCCHPSLLLQALPDPGHVALADEDLASDDEQQDSGPGVLPPEASGTGFGSSESSRLPAGVQPAPRCSRVLRKRPEVERFLLAFNLGPPEGFPDPGSTDEEEPFTSASPSSSSFARSPRPPAPTRPVPLGVSEVLLSRREKEGEEEHELTLRIRERQSEVDQVKRKWTERKERVGGERASEESLLRELLEKDKAREMQRTEREMEGLRSNFEFQVQAEKRWMDEFVSHNNYRNEWVCVFKPAMVGRKTPAEDGPISRRILANEVVRAKGKATDDHWIQLDGSNDWAITWHPKHGQLLQKWFGTEQKRFVDLEAKIAQRRKDRNETFVVYRRKKKEVSEWSIPPGPTEEELVEIEDGEGEQLHNLLEPILAELKEQKRRLRELRQKRLVAAVERSSGRDGLASGQLPMGFEGAISGPEVSHLPDPETSKQALQPWEEKKQAADKAFKEKDWNTALSLYSRALGLARSDASEPSPLQLLGRQVATLLSNRALVHARLFDWQRSLEDATAATLEEAEWPKGWLRRATAELRLCRSREALASLRSGLSFAGNITGQFLHLVAECEASLYSDAEVSGGQPSEAPTSAAARIAHFREEAGRAFQQGSFGVAVLFYTRALYHRSMMESNDEAVVLSNRSATFLRLNLASEALADALAASEKDPRWSKPVVRAGQAALMLDDFKAAYQYFAKARRLDEHYKAASEGVNSCLQKIIKWEYTAASRRWSRFSTDRSRPREGLRIWALSDVFFDQHGVPEWCKSLSSSFFRDDVLMLAGNLADCLPQLRFALTVLKSKFRRIFYVPGNHDLWVRRVTLQSLIRGEQVKDELRDMIDSVSKFLEVLQVCDELGVETAPAEVAAGVFVVPMFSWYSRDFVSKAMRIQNASKSDADAKVTIDQWIKWPFPCGSDDAWKFFMRMNEPALRATLVSKAAFERFSNQQATVLTMTHFLTRPDLEFDWTIPGIWDHVGCDGLDEQVRALGSDVHIYGRSCAGPRVKVVEGVSYVHNYIGSTEKHRPGMAPYCVFDKGGVMPAAQPSQAKGFNFQPSAIPRPEEPVGQRRFGGG